MLDTTSCTGGHTMRGWAPTPDTAPVIFPLHDHTSGETRGGIPLCVPMFSVQQRPVTGCKLPLHGLLMYSDHANVTQDAATTTTALTSHFPASSTFAWAHTVTTSMTETATSLSYTITITRAADCTNPSEMPLSLGFHPYLATHNADFTFTIGAQTWTRDTLPNNIIDSAFAPMRDTAGAVQPVTLTTACHTISITPTGFDEYCLWTDDAAKYICIEPIYQYREFGVPGTGLQAGEEKVVGVEIALKL